MSEKSTVENFNDTFVNMLKKGEEPHSELASTVQETLRKNFPSIESHTPELPQTLVRSDKYVAHMIRALEQPSLAARPDQLLSLVAKGLDANEFQTDSNDQLTGEHKSFDNGQTLQEFVQSVPENERPLLVFNMVMQCLTHEPLNRNRPDTLEIRLNSLATLLMSTEIDSFMPPQDGWGPRVKEKSDLGMHTNFVNAGKALERIIQSTTHWTDGQINDDTPAHKAIEIMRQHNVAPTPDSKLQDALDSAVTIAYQARPPAKAVTTSLAQPAW